MNELVNEFREGYQIPPYITDASITKLLYQSVAWAKTQVPFANYSDDETCKELILNRTFYAYNHQLSDFETDFEKSINTWKFSKVVGVE